MNLLKFTQFLNETVQIPVLDVVIDNYGNLLNGENNMPMVKGNIVQRKIDGKNITVDILGNNGQSYPAGIDKNGNLVAISVSTDGNYYALNSEDLPLRIPQSIKGFPSKFWKVYKTPFTDISKAENIDYFKILPKLSTGWVNVKIDMEIIKRVRRYAIGLGRGKGLESLTSKLNELERLSKGLDRRKRSRATIQKEMSVIMLLHYINEIKDYFTASSSGFLFESFLGGLITNAKVIEDNSKADIIADGESYQVKLYSGLENSISYNTNLVDYYCICFKYASKIDIYILNGKTSLDDPDNINNFLTPGNSRKEKPEGSKSTGPKLSASQIKNRASTKFTIELNNIEEKIKNISEGLKEALDDLYRELSEFQYNIETIITGVEPKGKKIMDDDQFKVRYDNALSNIKNLGGQVTSLYQAIDPKKKVSQNNQPDQTNPK
jgi:hypothetical protein